MTAKRQWQISIKQKVTLGTLAIFVVGIWALSYYVTRMLREDMQNLLADQQHSTVSYVASELNEALEERVTALETIAHSIDQSMLDNPASLQQMLDSQPIFVGLFNSGVVAVALDGTAVADSPVVANRRGTNYLSNEATHSALTEGKTIIGRPVMGRVLREPLFNINTPVRAAGGKVIGALFGVINLAKPNFLDRIAEHRYGKSGGYLVVAPQYKLLVTATDKARVMQPVPAPGINPLFDKRMQGFDGPEIARNSAGVETLTSARRIPVADWFVIATLPTDEAFAPINDMVQRILFVTLFLTLLAGALTWWMLKRQLAPMLATAKTLAALSDTNQPPQPLPITSKDEIGELIGGFNRLLETLRHREEALKESDVRFRSLTEMSSDFYWEQDENFRFTLNSSPIAIAALDLDVHGKTRWELGIQPEPGHDLAAHRATLAAHLPFRGFEYSVVRKERRMYFSVSGAPLFDDQGGFIGYRGVASNISERKQAEENLRRSRDLLRSVIEGTSDAIYVKDCDGRYTLFNSAAARFVGKSIGEVIGRDDTYLFPLDEARFLMARDRAVMASGTIKTYEEILTTASGDVAIFLSTKGPVVDEKGNVLGLFGIARDITERKHIEEELRLAKEAAEDGLQKQRILMAAIVESSEDAIVGKSLEGIVTSWNRGAETTFGYSANEMLGRSIFTLVPAECHDDEEKVLSTIRRGESITHFETERVRKDGSRIEVSIAVSPIRDKEGRIIGASKIARDITMRKQTERELRRSQQELRSLSKAANEALEAERRRTARELHDELGQLLTALKMDLESLRSALPLDKPDLVKRVQAMHTLLDATIAATRRIASDLRPLMLDDLGLAAALDWLVHNFSKRTGIATDLVIDETVAQVPEPISSALYRITQESLTNVAKYAQATRVEIRLEHDGDWVQLLVRDNGCGIEAADQKKRGRFGLLGIRERVMLLYGEVSIEGKHGQGSEVRARIPLTRVDGQEGEMRPGLAIREQSVPF